MVDLCLKFNFDLLIWLESPKGGIVESDDSELFGRLEVDSLEGKYVICKVSDNDCNFKFYLCLKSGNYSYFYEFTFE